MTHELQYGRVELALIYHTLMSTVLTYSEMPVLYEYYIYLSDRDVHEV
jgi:hypothetical protein